MVKLLKSTVYCSQKSTSIFDVQVLNYQFLLQKRHLVEKHRISNEDTKRIKKYRDAIKGKPLSSEKVIRKDQLEKAKNRKITIHQCPKCNKNPKGYATFSSLVRFVFWLYLKIPLQEIHSVQNPFFLKIPLLKILKIDRIMRSKK